MRKIINIKLNKQYFIDIFTQHTRETKLSMLIANNIGDFD